MEAILQFFRINLFRLFPAIKIQYDSRQYIPAFDGWRGVGVILVLLAHCYPYAITRPFWVAMDLFFVMSGFLITGILIDTKSNNNYYLNYISRRILRVFPLYYFVLFLSFIVIPFFSPDIMGPHYAYYIKHQAWFWLYGQNWLFSLTGFPENHIMVHFWSLAVEEQFYIFWPLLVKIFSSRRLLKVCVFLIAFSIYFRLSLGYQLGFTYTYPYVSTLSRMDSLSIGAIIAILIRERRHLLEKYTSVIAFCSALCALAGVFYYRQLNFLALPPIYTFVDIFAGCVLLYSLTRHKPLLIRWGEHRIFRFLGKYSYGIYIYHYIIFNILKAHLYTPLSVFFRSEWVPVLLIGLLTISVSVLVSILSYRYLELPFLKLKKFFSYQTGPKKIVKQLDSAGPMVAAAEERIPDNRQPAPEG